MDPLDDDADDARQVVSLNPDTLAALTEYANGHGITPAEAARRILVAELIDLDT